MTDIEECIICCRLVKRRRAGKETVNESNRKDFDHNYDALELQLPSLLLLRRLLLIPPDVCSLLVQDHGNPNSWLVWCDSCSIFIWKAEHLYEQLNLVEQKLDTVRADIKKAMLMLKDSGLSKTKVKERKNVGCNTPTEIIRSYAWSDTQNYSLNTHIKIEADSDGGEDMKNNTEFNEESIHSIDSAASITTAKKTRNPAKRIKLNESVPDIVEKSQRIVRKKGNCTGTGSVDYNADKDTEATDLFLDNCGDRSESSDEEDNEAILSEEIKGAKEAEPSVERRQCEVCDRTYSSWHTLRQHFRRVHGKYRYNCQLCNWESVSKAEQIYHTEKFHRADEERFFCQICQKSYSAMSRLRRHLRMNHNNNDGEIETSKQVGVTSQDQDEKVGISSHEQIVETLTNFVHVDDPYLNETVLSRSGAEKKCEKDNIADNSIQSSDTKDNAKKISCSDCNKTYSDYAKLRRHTLDCHEYRLIQCPFCKYKAICESDLKMHDEKIHKGEDIEGDFMCKPCNKIYKTKIFLILHRRQIHGRNSDELESTLRRRSSNHTVGNRDSSLNKIQEFGNTKTKNAESENSANRTISVYTSIKDDIVDNVSDDSPAVIPEVCHVCSKSYFVPYKLRKHFLKYHKLLLLQCTQCTYKAISNNDLNAHTNTTHSVKEKENFECKTCHKIYNLKFSLVCHLQNDHGEFGNVSTSNKPLAKAVTKNDCQENSKNRTRNLDAKNERLKLKKKVAETDNLAENKDKITVTPQKSAGNKLNKQPKDSRLKRKIKVAESNDKLTVHPQKSAGNKLDRQPKDKRLRLNKKVAEPPKRNESKNKITVTPQKSATKNLDTHPKDDRLKNKVAEPEKRTEDKDRITVTPQMSAEKDDFRCEKCGQMCVNWRNLRRHVQKFHEKFSYTCEICQRKLPSRVALDFHKKRFHHPDFESISCIKCNRNFSDKSNLRRHIRNFHSTKQSKSIQMMAKRNLFSCTICGEAFNLRRLLLKHRADIHAVGHKEIPTVEVDDKVISKKDVIQNDDLEVDTSQIESDRSTMDLKSGATEDIINKTLTGTNDGKINSSSVIVCQVCERSYETKLKHRKHFLGYHKDSLLPCEHCNFRALGKRDMEIHLENVHNINPKTYKCDTCNAMFTTKSFLQEHIRNVHAVWIH